MNRPFAVLGLFLLFLLWPGMSPAEQCTFPVLTGQAPIDDLVLEEFLFHQDLVREGPAGPPKCLAGIRWRSLENGPEPGESFGSAMNNARLSIRLAQMLRRSVRDPTAEVYRCPTPTRDEEFRILPSTRIRYVAERTGLNRESVHALLTREYEKQGCAPVPRIEGEPSPGEVPVSVLIYLLTEFPVQGDRPFPFTPLEGLNGNPETVPTGEANAAPGSRFPAF